MDEGSKGTCWGDCGGRMRDDPGDPAARRRGRRVQGKFGRQHCRAGGDSYICLRRAGDCTQAPVESDRLAAAWQRADFRAAGRTSRRLRGIRPRASGHPRRRTARRGLGHRGLAAAVRRRGGDRLHFPGWPPFVSALALNRHRRSRGGSGDAGRRPALGKHTRSALRGCCAARGAARIDHGSDAGPRTAGDVRRPDRRGGGGCVAVPRVRRRAAGADEVGCLRGEL